MSDNNKRILEAEDQRLKLSAEAIQSMKAGLTFAFEYIAWPSTRNLMPVVALQGKSRL
jgi:hypothetical protein